MASKEQLGDFKGKIVIAATSTAKEGQGDRAEVLLKAVQEHALSDQETGCLTFRVCRFGNEFLVFEEYENQAAIYAHLGSEPFKALSEEVTKGTLTEGESKVLLYEEK